MSSQKALENVVYSAEEVDSKTIERMLELMYVNVTLFQDFAIFTICRASHWSFDAK